MNDDDTPALRLQTIPLRPAELSAALFVECLSQEVDKQACREPCRETQREVATCVRRRFFDAAEPIKDQGETGGNER